MDIVQHRQPIGLEVIAALKTDPYMRNLQIIVLSADAAMLRQHAEQFMRDGIVALDKPYDWRMGSRNHRNENVRQVGG